MIWGIFWIAFSLFALADMICWRIAKGRGFRPVSLWFLLPGSGFYALRTTHSAGEAHEKT